MTPTKPQPIPASELSNLRMATGNEKKYTHVIHDGVLKHWVGYGWVSEGPATPEDYTLYPEVIE